VTDIDIHIKLFGAFRKDGSELKLRVPKGSTVENVKQQMSQKLTNTDAALVFDSVLADEGSILPDGYVLENNVDLSILPPVCGG